MATGSDQLDSVLRDDRVERIICLTPEGTDRRWWQVLRDPGKALFIGDEKRIFVCPLRRAAEAAQEARREGYRPIFFLPYRGFLSELNRGMKTAPFSVPVYSLGYDDEEMRFLLHHPAREVIDALAHDRPIRCPNPAFQQALEAWRKSKEAQEYIADVQEGVLRLEDFTLLGHEEEGEAREARLTASFAYKKDPRILLQLVLYRLRLQARLEWDAIGSVTFNGKSLRFHDRLLEFQQRSGRYEHVLLNNLGLLEEIVERFDLPEEFGLSGRTLPAIWSIIERTRRQAAVKLSAWQSAFLETLYATKDAFEELLKAPMLLRPGVAWRGPRRSGSRTPSILAVLPIEEDGHEFVLIWDMLPKRPLTLQLTVTLDGEPLVLPAEAIHYSEEQFPIRLTLPDDVPWNHEDYQFNRDDWKWESPQQLLLTLKTTETRDD